MKSSLLCVLIAAAAAVPAAAAPLVVRSAGPSAKAWPPGRAVDESRPVVLRAGDVVTVLAPSGARTLRGPGTFRLASAAGAAPAFNPRARFSATRGPGGSVAPSAPGLWEVDASAGGTVCLREGDPVLLWRPAADSEGALELAPAAGSGAELVAWPAGRAMQRWPERLPAADGSEYRLKWAGEGKPVRLRFRTLPAAGADATDLARAFIDRGCEAQLDRLLKTAPQQ